jgi:hypothetical protein
MPLGSIDIDFEPENYEQQQRKLSLKAPSWPVFITQDRNLSRGNSNVSMCRGPRVGQEEEQRRVEDVEEEDSDVSEEASVDDTDAEELLENGDIDEEAADVLQDPQQRNNHAHGHENVNEGPPPAVNEFGNLRQLIDEEEWLRSNGLAAEPRYGNESYNNQQEALEQIRRERMYQARVHETIFVEEDNKQRPGSAYSLAERKYYLHQWKDERLQLTVASGVVLSCNLADLAKQSQVVFAMAYINKRSSPSKQDQKRQRKEENQHPQSNSSTLCLSLSFEEYSKEVMESFLNLVSKCEPTNEDAEEQKLPSHAINSLPDHHIVDCCRIANYLQCHNILQQVVEEVLMPSIDSGNCMSLCQLADQLSLAKLHTASLNHVLKTLDSIQEEGSDNSGDLINTIAFNNTDKLNNEYLTPELQLKIKHVKQILMSQNRKNVFFDTFVEYIAMLAEQYQYYKERLDEAREQQAIHEPNTAGWNYSQAKIEQQAIKVKRLRTFLQEQKRVFGISQYAKQESA